MILIVICLKSLIQLQSYRNILCTDILFPSGYEVILDLSFHLHQHNSDTEEVLLDSSHLAPVSAVSFLFAVLQVLL